MRRSEWRINGRRIGFGAWVVIMAFAGVAMAAEPKTALTIYSKAAPGAIQADMYRPLPPSYGRGSGYNWQIPGYAIIKQDRDISIGAQRSQLRFSDVAAFIDPTTVKFTSLTDPVGTKVLEQDYQFDLVDQNKLMERYIDREITVEQIVGDSVQSYSGKLISSAGGSVTLLDSKGGVRVIRAFQNVLYPDLPGGLITRPTLMWDLFSKKPGAHRARVTYETGGITWWADYNLVYTEGKDANHGFLDLSAWVSVINRSGASYDDANLKLVAGDVNRAPTRPQAVGRAYRMKAEMALEDSVGGFGEKSFFEYHLYTLGRPTTLPDNSTKQIELFSPVNGVPVEKLMVYAGVPFQGYYYDHPVTDASFGQEVKSVDVYLQLLNSKENGMGMPLPAGRIRVSKMDTADGSLEFIGEDVIKHTPKDEKALVKLGRAFDVVGERKQVDFKVDTSRKTMSETIEIKIRNHKKEPVTVIAQERLYRWVNWNITHTSAKWTKEDSRTIHFPVIVAPDGESVVTYTVKYTW
ncbi:MAG: DUF4139 domain-containing protein [Nitrospinota bacterium]|nr:DUF4139 domain-containing protein [Nitrospinota bacterium]